MGIRTEKGAGKGERPLPSIPRLILALLIAAPSASVLSVPAGPDLNSILPIPRGIGIEEDRRDMLDGPSLAPDPMDEARVRLIAYALSWLGSPYRLGGFSTSGVDCSGFVNRVVSASFPQLTAVPRQSETFAAFGTKVEDILPGDILLFSREGDIYHVGLALSGSTFIHSASEGDKTGVIISSIWEGNWRSRLCGVRRIAP